MNITIKAAVIAATLIGICGPSSANPPSTLEVTSTLRGVYDAPMSFWKRSGGVKLAVNCPISWNGNTHFTGSCGQSVQDACGKRYDCNQGAKPLCDEQGGCTCQSFSACN